MTRTHSKRLRGIQWPEDGPDECMVSPVGCLARSPEEAVHARTLYYHSGIVRHSRRDPATAKYDPNGGMARGFAAIKARALEFIEAHRTACRIRDLADSISPTEAQSDLKELQQWALSQQQPQQSSGYPASTRSETT